MKEKLVMRKKLLLYIGGEEFIGKSVSEIIKTRGGFDTDEGDVEVQICGDRGSPEGYAVTTKYIIRPGDMAILMMRHRFPRGLH